MAGEIGGSGLSSFLKKLLTILLVVVLAWLAWKLQFVLLLVFGAVLLAIIIKIGADGLHGRLKMPGKMAFIVTVLVIFGVPVFALWSFGAEIVRQADQIAQAVPEAIAQIRQMLVSAGIGDWTENNLSDAISGSEVYASISGLLLTAADALTNLVIVIVGGIYLAASPALYKRGFLKLVPPRSRSMADTVLCEMGTALGLWLKGRLLAMLLVGVLTGLGLWLIGVPSYLALGLLAGLLEFVPFIGPIIAAIPAILLAFLGGPTDALLVAGLFLVIQQLEGNVITPIIQHHAVDLPPALLIFAVLGFGALFGIVGVILAAPLTVVLFIMVKRLYVREYLHTATVIPGTEHDDDGAETHEMQV